MPRQFNGHAAGEIGRREMTTIRTLFAIYAVLCLLAIVIPLMLAVAFIRYLWRKGGAA